ncbi:MAG: protein translocase subunit SecD [Deltaproteobacteria bacterium]|nr:protein translocase subunit SecD [Deltaproteobacteria bacterium]
MKFPWKGIGILFVLIIALYYNYPTLVSFMPERENIIKDRQKEIHQEIKEVIDSIKGFNLALAEADKNRIQLIMDDGFEYPKDNKALDSILDDDFSFMKNADGSFLMLKPDHSKGVFISKVALNLNTLFTSVRKIKEIKLSDDQQEIYLVMEKDKRLSTLTEPIKSILEMGLEMSYQDDQARYVLTQVQNENIVNLGLDLQGGMYQDIGVKTDEVIQVILDDLAVEIENYLIEDNINYESVSRISDTEVQVVYEADEEFPLTGDKYDRLLNRYYDVIPMGNGYMITILAEEASLIKKRALEQALETIRNRIDLLGVKEPTIQQQGENSIIIQLPGLKDPEKARRVIGQVAVLQFMMVAAEGSVENPGKGQIVMFEEVKDPDTKEIISTRPYLLEKKVLLKGERIRDARVGFLPTGSAYVGMSFDEQGKELFGKITAANVGRLFAIVLDGKVQSAPRINEAIEGGEAQITGSFTPEEASELALVLRSGALPAPIIINEERTIGASLGDDSIRQAMISLVIGFVAVLIFMIVYYMLSGIFAIMALFFNLILIVAALAYFQATLTLPGMAGIILTIGMAVDANVLIYERIREELMGGSPVRNAINTGFQKATITILDSNITTVLAAIVLFQFGTGPIKGFSVTLSIGIIASMFTSLILGRFLFEIFYLRRKKLIKISI